jgi:hypothetical protein
MRDLAPARYLLAVLFCLALAAPAGAQDPDPAGSVQRLIQLREDLAGKLTRQRRANRLEVLRLHLPAGADSRDVEITLARTAGEKQQGHAVVPAWNQSTMQEWRAWHHRNGAGAAWRDNHPFPVDFLPAGQDGHDRRIRVNYRLDKPLAEHLPPGEPNSWWDKFIPVGLAERRPQTYDLQLRPIQGGVLVEMILDGGIHWQNKKKKKRKSEAVVRRPIFVRMLVPANRFAPVWVSTPTWNGGYHEGDATGLRWADGKLTGELKIYINSDGWYPWRGSGRKPLELRFQLDGTLKHHELTGSFQASGDMGQYDGRIRGSGGQAVAGRFRSTGRLPDSAGQLYGMKLTDFAPVDRQLTPLPAGKLPKGAELARLADALLRDIRALSLALDNPHLPLAEAINQSRSASPVWPEQPQAGHLARYVHTAADWMQAAAESEQMPAARAVSSDSPTLGTVALAVDDDGQAVLPDTIDPDAWYTVPRWRIVGPFAQRPGTEHNQAVPVECIPADLPMRQDFDRFGARIANAQPQSWRTVQTHTDRIADPKAKAGFYARFRGDLWYASAVVRADKARLAVLAIEAADHAKCWINGKLVWTGTEKVYRYHSLGRQLVPVQLAAGQNVILLRVHRDRKPAWVRLAMKFGPLKEPSPLIADGNDPDRVFPAADPPIAWDIPRGINVAWRREDLGGSSRPTVHDGKVYLTRRPDRLICLDPSDGQDVFAVRINPLSHLDADAAGRWAQASPAEKNKLIADRADALGLRRYKDLGDLRLSRPLVTRDGVYAHVGTGALVALDSSGTARWTARTDLGRAVLYDLGDRIVLEGPVLRSWKLPADMVHLRQGKKTQPVVGVVVIEASTGKVLARLSMPGEFDDDASFLLPAPRRGASALLTATGMVVDLGETPKIRGPLLSELPGPTTETFQAGGQTIGPRSGRPFAFCAAGGRLFMTTQEQTMALQVWARPDSGPAGYRQLWQSNYEHTGFSSFLAPSVATGKYLFKVNPVLERGPHCPDPRLELHVQDAATGRPLGRLKPALSRAVQHRVAPVIAGDYIYCTDSGGGSHGGLPDAGQILVATADADLVPLARNRVDLGTGQPPVFVGSAMILRSGRAMTCIAVTDPQGRAYQARVLAETVLADLGPEPTTATPAEVQPAKMPVWDPKIPISPLAPEVGTDDWLAAGPFDQVDPDKLAEMQDVRIGQTVRMGQAEHAFQPLGREFTYPTPPNYVAQYMLQGTGEIVPVFSTRLDPRCCAGPDGAGLFYTVLDNNRDRYVVSSVPAKGIEQWLAGQEISADKPVHLPAGRYGWLIAVGPEHFAWEKPEILQPIDVRAALEAKAIQPVDLSTWKVIGPLPADAAPLKPAELKQMPESVTVGERKYPAYSLPADGRTVYLTALLGLREGQKPDAASAPKTVKIATPQRAYAMVEIQAPADGYLYLTAGADWFFRWILDGQVVYDRIKAGNGAAPTEVGAHPVALRLGKGKHVLVAEVKPGSRGWSISAAAGFSTKAPAALSDYHTASKIQPKAPDPRIRPAFVEIPHPPTRQARWQNRLARRAPILVKALKALDASADARKKAEEIRQVLDQR